MGLRLLRNPRGLTLVDMVVGLAVFSLAAAGIFAGFKGALTAWTVAQQVTGEQHNARVTLEWLVRRLRMAGQGYAGIPFRVANRSDVRFLGDISGNGVECHRIYLNSGIVYAARYSADCSTLIVEQALSTTVEARSLGVTGLVLRYFGDSPGPGDELCPVPRVDCMPLSASERSQVRRMEIQIEVSGLQFLGSMRLTSQVSMR